MPRNADEGKAREAVLCVRLSDADMKALDAKRGTKSRSAFVREVVKGASRGGKGAK